jgi:hypothetical protein
LVLRVTAGAVFKMLEHRLPNRVRCNYMPHQWVKVVAKGFDGKKEVLKAL